MYYTKLQNMLPPRRGHRRSPARHERVRVRSHAVHRRKKQYFVHAVHVTTQQIPPHWFSVSTRVSAPPPPISRRPRRYARWQPVGACCVCRVRPLRPDLLRPAHAAPRVYTTVVAVQTSLHMRARAFAQNSVCV